MSTSLDRRTELAEQIRAGCNQLLESQPVRTDWLGRTPLVLTLGLLPAVEWFRKRRDPSYLTGWERTRYRIAQMTAFEDGSERRVRVVSYGNVPPTISKRVEVHIKDDWGDFLTFTPKGVVVSSFRALGRGVIAVKDNGEPSTERLQHDEIFTRLFRL